jgi:acyl-CoA hydrolase
MPKHCNHHFPMIFGGEFLAQMDIAAAMLVSRLLNSSTTAQYAVTHKVSCEFTAAAQMGDIIDLWCEIIELRKKGIGVNVKAMRERRGSDQQDCIATANFVFVSKCGENYVHHGLSLE